MFGGGGRGRYNTIEIIIVRYDQHSLFLGIGKRRLPWEINPVRDIVVEAALATIEKLLPHLLHDFGVETADIGTRSAVEISQGEFPGGSFET